MDKKLLLSVIALFLLVLGACGAEKATNDEQPDQTPKEESSEDVVEVVDTEPVNETEKQEEQEEQEPDYKHIYPLTGIGTNDSVDNRIIAVMINNHTYARPQSGLNEADVVYEVLAEGPITRFVALYHSEQPQIVGPVRSAREYYINLANAHNAIYVYHGAATYIQNMIRGGMIDHLDGAIYDNDQHLFKRENFRNAPHNSYLLINAAYEVAEKRGYNVKTDHKPLPFLNPEEVEAINGNPATDLKIVYSDTPLETVSFEYVKEKEKYVRYNDGKKTSDLNSKEPLLVDNIFIVETHHEVIDSKLRRAIDLQSGGKGYLVQKGKFQEVQWKNVDGQILPYKDGQPVGFVPGKTWVNIVPETPGLTQIVSFTSETH